MLYLVMEGPSFKITLTIVLEDHEADDATVKDAIENAIVGNVPTAFNEHGQNTCGLSEAFDAYVHEFTIDSIEVTTVRKQMAKYQ